MKTKRTQDTAGQPVYGHRVDAVYRNAHSSFARPQTRCARNFSLGKAEAAATLYTTARQRLRIYTHTVAISGISRRALQRTRAYRTLFLPRSCSSSSSLFVIFKGLINSARAARLSFSVYYSAGRPRRQGGR